MDTIDRAGWNAQIATGAFALDYRMHMFCAAKDSVYRTGLYAQGATDTGLLIDTHDGGHILLFAMRCIQWFYLDIEQIGQRDDGRFTTRRALVDIGFAGRDRLGVRAAAGIGALAALCLR
jgi:hypothetical protein